MTVTATPQTIPFPAGVFAVTLAGTLVGVLLSTDLPDAVLTLQVADQNSEYHPVMVPSAPGGAYPRALEIPVGLGGFFPIPLAVQAALPTDIQLTLTNAGADAVVELFTS
jgi:hypothetical protein